MTPSQADVEVIDHGTVVLFRPITQTCQEWIEDNVQQDAMWFGGSLAAEHRYALLLIEGMADDGLTLG